MGNEWIARWGQYFAGWDARLPCAEPEVLVTLTRAISSAGESNRVHHVRRSATLPPFDESRDGSYADWVEKRFRTTGAVPFFALSPETRSPHGPGSCVEATICVEKDGRAVEVRTDDLGQVLRTTRTEELDPWHGWAAAVPALLLMGEVVGGSGQDAVVLEVRLPTYIWFPRVRGWFSHEDQEWFDNRLQASCHTPRLNAFLVSAAEAVRQAGGTWEPADPEECEGTYSDMVDIHGVVLGD